VTRIIRAPRALVYRALLDPADVERWMVPESMTSHIHSFDAHVGGGFRISLTYDIPTDAGKTSARTDTYHGTFVRLVPDEQVVEVLEFETSDPAIRGLMTVTFTLADADAEGGTQGTEITGVHDHLPRGVPPADNELGWRESFAKLARLVEGRALGAEDNPAAGGYKSRYTKQCTTKQRTALIRPSPGSPRKNRRPPAPQ
jgi:uncharacterized protein YndB with AHSA1/START domain